MKWPTELTLIRHGESVYNALRRQKERDPEYLEFQTLYRTDPQGDETRRLALIMKERYSTGTGDYETELTPAGIRQARVTGTRLSEYIALPDVVLYSPYLRTKETLKGLRNGWHDLQSVRVVEDDRIREQEHGLSLIYSDWRIFHTMHPEQRELRERQGSYWYQYPQGESVSMVRERVRSMLTTLSREYQGQRVLMVTHHLTILSIRATLERLTPEQFIALDEHEKPLNCGVTVYRGNPTAGKDGRLELKEYNQRLY